MTRIAESNVLITGGASGIGRQLALKMGQRGATVVLWDVDPERLADALAQVESSGAGGARGYLCDVSDRSRVYETAETVKRDVGPIHILVNNAGVVSGKRLLDCPDEQIERTMAVNATALFWTTKAFLPDMNRNGAGHLVTVASAAGTIGVVGLADYCASKWAAVGFDEAVRMELKSSSSNVKTTVVCPFFVDTGMFRGVKTRFSWPLPILKEDYVAERIVRAIERDRPRLMMPAMVYLVPLLRALPVRWFDALADFFGINRSMDEFVGRSGSLSGGESRSPASRETP
jgi:all-trans-retinol dehydrogenase (NAD+)